MSAIAMAVNVAIKPIAGVASAIVLEQRQQAVTRAINAVLGKRTAWLPAPCWFVLQRWTAPPPTASQFDRTAMVGSSSGLAQGCVDPAAAPIRRT
jgi:hypothetical protein